MSSRTPTPSEPLEGGSARAPQTVAEMSGRLRELRDTLWAARAASELMDTVVAVEALRSQLDAVELAVVAELEQRGDAKAMGWASTGDFLTAVSGGVKGSGPALVRLAKASRDPVLAPIATAMAEGWLSCAKAHVITRAVEGLPLSTQLRSRGVVVLLEEATRLDATELRQAARHLAAVVDPDGQDRKAERELAREERAAHLSRHLSITDDLAGGALIRGRCSSEDAAAIKSALLPLSRPHPHTGPVCDPHTCAEPGCCHDGRDPRDHGARMLDALVEACRRWESADLLPQTHGATPRISVTMRLEDLRAGAGFARTETGEQLSPEAARRVACEAGVIPIVLGAASEVLDVGRLQRLVTPAIWRALVARDGHCRFPRCTRPPVMSHAHHLTHWVDGGPTSLDNLILLCGHHHRLVHAGPWSITKAGPTAFDFDPPPGSCRVGAAPRPPPHDRGG